MKFALKNRKVLAALLAMVMVVSIASLAYGDYTSGSTKNGITLTPSNASGSQPFQVEFKNTYKYSTPEEPEEPEEPSNPDNGLITISKIWDPEEQTPTDWGVKITVSCDGYNLPSGYSSIDVFLYNGKSSTTVSLPVYDLDGTLIEWKVTETAIYKNYGSDTQDTLGQGIYDVFVK